MRGIRESEGDRINREDGMAPGGVLYEDLHASLRANIAEGMNRIDPEYEARQRWMRRQRLKTPFRRVWHRLLRHEVGRYACFTCDMDLP